MDWIKSIFTNFWRSKAGNFFKLRKEMQDISRGFSEEQKMQLVNSAITTSQQILISACVLADAQNYITGDCIFPDGTKWRMKFYKVVDEVGGEKQEP